MRTCGATRSTIAAVGHQFLPDVNSYRGADMPIVSAERDAILRHAVRRRLPGGACLFRPGEPAPWIYIVETGRLLVHRSGPGGRPIVRHAGSGDLLVYDCDGSHVALCRALVDSVVCRIDRRHLEGVAASHPELADLLMSMHERELAMILESIAPWQNAQSASGVSAGPARLHEHHGSAGAVVLPFTRSLQPDGGPHDDRRRA